MVPFAGGPARGHAPARGGLASVAFAGKTVVVWGCGALGAPVAEAVARVGPAKLVLYDNGIVAPGLLVRQPFADADIGQSEGELSGRAPACRAPWRRTSRRAPTTSCAGRFARADWSDSADVLIDATASTAVSAKLERVRAGAPAECFVVSAAFGHEATRGLVTVSPPRASGWAARPGA
jgi:tRNA A37 threonylcarbamoyladenosine dehydratase